MAKNLKSPSWVAEWEDRGFLGCRSGSEIDTVRQLYTTPINDIDTLPQRFERKYYLIPPEVGFSMDFSATLVLWTVSISPNR
jgi:hypothetical protein